ncbi:hypothetical protein D9M73_175180 [compost metagenome]
MTQPGFDRGHFFQALGVEHRAHGTAIRMPADDDVVHAQRQDGVLNCSGNPTVHLPIRGYHITHVTGHEQIAGGAVGDQFRHDARVGTGDEHRTWTLGRRQLLEQFFLLGENLVMKMQKAVNDVL